MRDQLIDIVSCDSCGVKREARLQFTQVTFHESFYTVLFRRIPGMEVQTTRMYCSAKLTEAHLHCQTSCICTPQTTLQAIWRRSSASGGGTAAAGPRTSCGRSAGCLIHPIEIMFYDLNLPEVESDASLAHRRTAQAVRLGWGATATAHTASETLTSQDR